MPVSNVAMNAIKGLGERASAFFGSARVYGDKVMSNRIAAYSTIAAGTVAAGALYGNDHPVLGTMALAATGGLGYSAAARGHFGSQGLMHAASMRDLAGMGKQKVNAVYRYSRMRGRGFVSGMRSSTASTVRNNHPDVPFSHWTSMSKNAHRGPNDAWTMRRES